ncbi:terminase small subunit [Megasphaera sp. UPII 135-E]|uniref:terminase small subunit n=1 Tax=Megasphaera sp. UPII 135-E TaxID=1000569 RepID=UPI00021A1FED|nr:terminase small subunit family protein [Megasphaera sp. UPII 135-E]
MAFLVAQFQNEWDGGEHVVKLTEKQERFIDYYIETNNASEAARLAGYSKRTAKSMGSENLTKPAIQQAIEKRLQELKNERTATLQETLEFMTAVMRGNVEEEVVVTEGTGDGCSESRIMPKKPSVRDRLEAAKELERRLGRFVDLEKEEQQLRIEKLKADIAERHTDTQTEPVTFMFDRKKEYTDES